MLFKVNKLYEITQDDAGYEEENLGLTPAALKNLFVEKKESEVTRWKCHQAQWNNSTIPQFQGNCDPLEAKKAKCLMRGQ